MLTREQVASVLPAYRAGKSRRQVADQLHISYPTVCRVIRLRSFEGYARERDTVKTLKRMEALLRNRVRKTERLLKISTHVIRRMQPNARKRALLGTVVRARYHLSRQETNKVVGVSSAAGCRKHKSDVSKAIVADMTRYFDQNPGQGFRKVFHAILKGQPYNQCHLHALYVEAKLMLDSRESEAPGKRSTPARVQRPMQVQCALNDMWSMDFMTDVTTKGKRFWIFEASSLIGSTWK